MEAVRRSVPAPTFVGGPPRWNPCPPFLGGVRSHRSSEALVGWNRTPPSCRGRSLRDMVWRRRRRHRARRRALATSDAGFALSDSPRFIGEYRGDSNDRGCGPRGEPSDNANCAQRVATPTLPRRARSEERRASSGGSPRAIPWPSARRAAEVLRSTSARCRPEQRPPVGRSLTARARDTAFLCRTPTKWISTGPRFET